MNRNALIDVHRILFGCGQEMNQYSYTACGMKHENFLPEYATLPSDDIDPETHFRPQCADRRIKPFCNHLPSDNAVSRGLNILTSEEVYIIAHAAHAKATKLLEEWRASQHKRDVIDRHVVELLPESRYKKESLELVQLERKRHTTEIANVKKICKETQTLFVEVMQIIEELLDT